MLEILNQQLLPIIYSNKINSVLEKKYKKQLQIDVVIESVEELSKSIELLEKEITIQYERKNKLEDKAKSILFVITIAITTITFSLNNAKEYTQNAFPLILISLSIFYFIFAGIQALSTINVRKFHILQPLIIENENLLIMKQFIKDENYLKNITRSKYLNDLITSKISNSIFSAFILIRNGLILYLLFFIINIIY